jgi:asparagine synthase (glutamine-hydrolysing)
MENGLFLTYSGFKAAKGQVDLIVAGDGADQLFGTGGFVGGRPIALRFLLERLYLRGILDKGRKYLISSSFYRDSPLFKAKVLLDRAVDFNDWFFWGFDEKALKQLCSFPIDPKDIHCFSNRIPDDEKGFEKYYQYASIHQDFEHYVCQNVLVKSFRMAEMSGVLLREAYLDKEVIDFVLPLAFTFKTKGRPRDFLKGGRVTKYLHRLAMNNILPEEILKKPKQGGFVPMTFLLRNPQTRRRVFDYLVDSNPLDGHLNMAFLKVLLRNYEESLRRGAYWQAYQESKANQIMNILALSLWYEIHVKGQFKKPPKDGLTGFIGH